VQRLARWVVIALINLGLLAVMLLVAEVAMQKAFPCDMSGDSWHWSFVPGIGNVYVANDIVRQTKKFDNFCVEQRSNSLGFLDHEPPTWDEIKDKPRIAVVGDSLIEATQVKQSDKMQQWLAKDLAAAGIDASVVAWGISGFGQVQELELLKRYGLSLHPNVVVLVIVGNDIKNNSWLLQAVQDGVEPDTPYNVEIRPVPLTAPRAWETIAPLPIAEVKKLPEKPRQQMPAWAQWLNEHSALYGYVLHMANYNYPRVYALLGGVVDEDRIQNRVRYLSRDPDLAPLLAGWPTGEDWKYDAISWTFEHLPHSRAFDLAVQATEHSMDQWVDLARREHFRIVALMLQEFDDMPWQAAQWRRILAERGIAAIWHGDFMRSHGYDPTAAHFARDPHWSPLGHRWAAEAVADFLKGHFADYFPKPDQIVEPQDYRASSSRADSRPKAN
jgi:hypothetical protein